MSIADDRHLAAQFCQYYSLGDTPDAHALVTDEARAILGVTGEEVLDAIRHSGIPRRRGLLSAPVK